MPIVYRLTKGSPLTHAELDGNFQFLTGSINNISGAYATTGSNTFIGNQTIQGNLSVFGNASFTSISSSVTTISASTFAVTISNPTVRYGFYEVLDTGSISTSSLAWDSTNKYWLFRNVTGSVTSSAILLTGPVGTGGLGTEVSIPQYRIPISNGNQSLISSNIYSSGSTHIVTGSLNVTGSITGSLSGTASYALTALNAVNATNAANAALATNATSATLAIDAINATSASYALTSSFSTTSSYSLIALTANTATNATNATLATSALTATNATSANTATSASFSTNSLLFNNRISTTFANTGSNNFIGIQNITGSLIVTGSLIRSGSSTFKNVGTAEMTGSLLINTLDGRRLFIASSSLSSSLSSSNQPTTATFNGVISLVPTVGIFPWNSNFDIYYSGVSGSGETEVSSVYNASFNNNPYTDFKILVSNTPQINLLPLGGVPQSYKLYIYNSGSAGTGWYVKSNLSETDLANGIVIPLSGPTDTTFDSDLISDGFTFGIVDPTGNTNTITYVSQSLLTFTSSLVDINAPTTITGSLNVSGSTLFVGTHTLSGSNTITGNTVLSGSITVSGSTTFRNNIFTVTGSQFYTGSSVYVGNQTITGSLSLQSNGIGTGLFINGQKQFNYIALSHTASILPAQNVSGSFIYNTTEHSSGISVTNNSRITFANTGIYNIQFSAQLYAPTNNTNVYIWFKKNGTNIANSATLIDIGSADYGVAAWNYVDTFTSGSYAEIAYQTDQNNVQFQYAAATGNIPAIPSIIATVTQIA
jgi:hypothetical protein